MGRMAWNQCDRTMELHCQRQIQKRPKARIINNAQARSQCQVLQVLPNNNGSRGRSCTQKLSAHVDLSNAATEKKCPKCQFVSFSVSQFVSQPAVWFWAVGIATWLPGNATLLLQLQTKILINHNETRKIFFKKSAIAKGARIIIGDVIVSYRYILI